jgi:DNA (cytosine-5)-methyltransferase 1
VTPDAPTSLTAPTSQGFSISNSKRDPLDERNVLYLQLVRLLKLRRPRVFLFENVRGLIMGKMEEAGIYNAICTDLEECGYKVFTRLLDAQDYGVPQHRERVIFLGVRNDFTWYPEWPTKAPRRITLREAIDGVTDALPNHVWSTAKIDLDAKFRQGNTLPKWDRPSLAMTKGAIPHPSSERRMSVRESARIQTFPDDMVFYGSLAEQYKQIGNAVPCVLAKQLAKMVGQFFIVNP